MTKHLESSRARAWTTAMISLAALALVSSPIAARAQEGSRPQVVTSTTHTLTAKVTALDYQTRMITLKRSDGKTATFRVDDRFPNLDKVKKGDKVDAVYYESSSISVQAPGSAGRSASEAFTSEPPGNAPAATIIKTTTAVSTVLSIDYEKRIATLQDPDGKRVTIHAGPEVKRFHEIRKGDQIVVQVTEALAVSVRK